MTNPTYSQGERTAKAVPFRVEVPQTTLDKIRDRVRIYEWHEMPASGGWNYGTNLNYMRELSDYWVNQYNWRQQEQEMNRFNHYKANVDGERIHFIHEKGSGNNPQALLLLHGWPYSFYSFINVIELLAHPERFGGNAEDGFDVTVASLPGYSFSDKPANPLGSREIGYRMNRLMTDVFGYDHYIVHGGDWGGDVASWIGYDHAPACQAIHIHAVFVRHDGAPPTSGETGPGPATEAERAFVQREQQVWASEGAYFLEQATRPQTLSYGMMDSPVGAAAWIIEKWYWWSDRRERKFEEIFTKDQLLTEVVIYLVTRTFNTASWIYAGYLAQEPKTLPPGNRIEIPVGIAAYPDPVFQVPPRSYVERSHKVVQYTEMPRGGHYPFLEDPQPYIEEIRKFGQLIR